MSRAELGSRSRSRSGSRLTPQGPRQRHRDAPRGQPPRGSRFQRQDAGGQRWIGFQISAPQPPARRPKYSRRCVSVSNARTRYFVKGRVVARRIEDPHTVHREFAARVVQAWSAPASLAPHERRVVERRTIQTRRGSRARLASTSVGDDRTLGVSAETRHVDPGKRNPGRAQRRGRTCPAKAEPTTRLPPGRQGATTRSDGTSTSEQRPTRAHGMSNRDASAAPSRDTSDTLRVHGGGAGRQCFVGTVGPVPRRSTSAYARHARPRRSREGQQTGRHRGTNRRDPEILEPTRPSAASRSSQRASSSSNDAVDLSK